MHKKFTRLQILTPWGVTNQKYQHMANPQKGGGGNVLKSSIIMFWWISPTYYLYIHWHAPKNVCVRGGGVFLQHSYNFLYIYVVHMKKKYPFGEKEREHPPSPLMHWYCVSAVYFRKTKNVVKYAFSFVHFVLMAEYGMGMCVVLVLHVNGWWLLCWLI